MTEEQKNQSEHADFRVAILDLQDSHISNFTVTFTNPLTVGQSYNFGCLGY